MTRTIRLLIVAAIGGVYLLGAVTWLHGETSPSIESLNAVNVTVSAEARPFRERRGLNYAILPTSVGTLRFPENCLLLSCQVPSAVLGLKPGDTVLLSESGGVIWRVSKAGAVLYPFPVAVEDRIWSIVRHAAFAAILAAIGLPLLARGLRGAA